jgi:hypothetical protein
LVRAAEAQLGESEFFLHGLTEAGARGADGHFYFRAARRNNFGTVLATRWYALRTVPAPTPKTLAISRQERP